MNKLPDTLNRCEFLELTDLRLSDEAMDCLSQSGNLTFGDANRTLYTLARIKYEIDAELESDIEILNQAIEKYTEHCYIDLEN